MTTTAGTRPAIAARILDIASGLFFREGIRAVGIDRIIAEADIAKATLYRHFPSKEDLVLAYLQDRHARVMQGLEAVLAAHADAAERISVIFERLAEKAENPEFRGCAFALAVAEHGDSEKVIALARMHKLAVAELLCGVARAAGLADADRIGGHLALLYDGALARRAVLGHAQPMREARISALALIAGAARQLSDSTD
ncbi:TetR family transcriptional regulator [Paracoccus limosus]|uniref:TetR family transcriptional regulator n=1 Tax=Paracoccus limosus TaxID=913252 RepID=A0A844H628_9RHOB|nr:TetR/AcrR family transcriptional regulator [Paracoccus limosus]MTH36232.1 TetR family transcriptional regulator [Paracoccus limosus]